MTTPVRPDFLQVRELTVECGGRTILRNVDLTVASGEFLAIVGRNGAGKSTVLKALIGASMSTGALFIEGSDLRAISPRERAQRIAYLPQQSEIPRGLTAYDYIALGRHPWRTPLALWSEEDRTYVEEAVVRAGAGELLGRAVDSLSGGERQRVFLAAALAQRAKLLLLDEPSTALDPVQRSELWALLARVRKECGVAIIAVTHDVDSITRTVDRIVAFREGAVFFDGAPGQFVVAETLAAVYGGPVDLAGGLR